MAIEIVDLPINSMVDLSSSQTVSHYQRVTIINLPSLAIINHH